MTVQDMKLGEVYLIEGLTQFGEKIMSPIRLIRYNGMNKYIVETGNRQRITMLLDGNDTIYSV